MLIYVVNEEEIQDFWSAKHAGICLRYIHSTIQPPTVVSGPFDTHVHTTGNPSGTNELFYPQ